ncbi:Polysaccharide deacetylase [Rhodospirillaceae bacterium LM-1]|nr:Polysaccharide deacetylase [Rhodospirillaceae bacterium LM-1]
MDDVGASTKRYNIHSNRKWSLGPLTLSANWLFLKYLPSLKCWGPYRELGDSEWLGILRLLEQHHAKLTVAVTACWVDYSGSLTPFPERFPKQAEILKCGVDSGLIEIANHGLTHCVLNKNAFRPRLFSSNRNFHREFWDWLPDSLHQEHVARSQEILQQWIGIPVTTFVPPGNVFSATTVDAAFQNGLRIISCRTEERHQSGINIIGERDIIAFHDRDVVVNGLDWFRSLLASVQHREVTFVRDVRV